MVRVWFSGADWGPWAGFIGRGRGERFFGPGEVRLALLSLLADGPKHGYELMKELEARSGGVYRASAGTIYPTLQQLEDEGMATSEQTDGKKTYRLTAAGKAELEREADTVRRIWQRADGWEDWGRCMGPEVAIIAGPIARLVKTAMRAVKRGAYNADLVAKIQEILERARRELEKVEQS